MGYPDYHVNIINTHTHTHIHVHTRIYISIIKKKENETKKEVNDKRIKANKRKEEKRYCERKGGYIGV